MNPSAAQWCASLQGARDALEAGHVGDVLTVLSGKELAAMMELADAVKARAEAVQVRLTAEAAHRGEFTSARRGEGSVHSWVREHAPSLRQGGSGLVAQLAQDAAASVPAGRWSSQGPCAGAFADPDRPEGVVWARLITGEVGPALATTTLREMSRMREMLMPAALPTVTDAILDHGTQWGLAEARRLRPQLIARFGREGEFDEQQERLRSGAHLSSPRVSEGDLTEYRMGLTPEQAATLEAAIGPLSQPAPNDVTGERDLRPAGQRRAEALATLCAGAVSAQGASRRSPGSASMALHVTMTLDELLRRFTTDGSDMDAGGVPPQNDRSAGGGRVLASRAQGTLLRPEAVRRLSCDADVIPVVLGSSSEVLDLGRAVRLFSRAQRRALWHRDGGCTYPGCDMPAGWVQIHHVVHWVDGGLSDLSNAALLCQRHHTQVHDRRLIARVHPPDGDGRSVTWDLTPGSYDRAMPGRRDAIRRARAGRHEGVRLRGALDTGPPDPWASAPPDDVLRRWADDFLAEQRACELSRAQLDDDADVRAYELTA